jgi:hypothetical protein
LGKFDKRIPRTVTAKTSEGTKFTPIPVFSARYQNFLLSGSFYPSTDFSFPLASQEIALSPNRPPSAPASADYLTEDVSAERDEWDITGGYYLSPYSVLLVGYKKITQDFTTTRRFLNRNLNQIGDAETTTATTEISGPVLGAAAAIPIGRGFGFFGSYAHGFLETEFSGGTRDADASYDLIELGVSYTHVLKKGGAGFYGTLGNYVGGISGYLGYRVQLIKTELEEISDSDDEAPDTTDGFTLGFNVAF